MKVRIEIRTENAAFDHSPLRETVRILKEVIRKYEETGSMPENLKDINGNTVGHIYRER